MRSILAFLSSSRSSVSFSIAVILTSFRQLPGGNSHDTARFLRDCPAVTAEKQIPARKNVQFFIHNHSYYELHRC